MGGGGGGGGEHRRCTFRGWKRRQTDELDGVEPLAPFGLAEVEAVRRQWLVTRTGTSFGAMSEVLPAGIVIVPDLGEALVSPVLGQWLDRDPRAGQIIKQRIQAVAEHRQPILHPRLAAPFPPSPAQHICP